MAIKSDRMNPIRLSKDGCGYNGCEDLVYGQRDGNQLRYLISQYHEVRRLCNNYRIILLRI